MITDMLQPNDGRLSSFDLIVTHGIVNLEIHFFGDKTFEGGNDFEIFSSPRTIGHAIADADPLTTLKKLSELFGVACPSALSPPGSH